MGEVVHKNRSHLQTDLLFVFVEDCHNAKAPALETRVVGNGIAQRTSPHQDNRPDPVHIQNLLQLIAEKCDVVASPLLAKLAKMAQVLANLRRTDPQMLAQLLAGCHIPPLVGQQAQGAQIDRQTADYDVWNLFAIPFTHSRCGFHRCLCVLGAVPDGSIEDKNRPPGRKVLVHFITNKGLEATNSDLCYTDRIPVALSVG